MFVREDVAVLSIVRICSALPQLEELVRENVLSFWKDAILRILESRLTPMQMIAFDKGAPEQAG